MPYLSKILVPAQVTQQVEKMVNLNENLSKRRLQNYKCMPHKQYKKVREKLNIMRSALGKAFYLLATLRYRVNREYVLFCDWG